MKNGTRKKESTMNSIKCIILGTALATCLGASSLHAVPLKPASETAAVAQRTQIELVEYSRGPRFPGDTWDFRNPRMNDAIVDACAVWGHECGAGGAAQYCRLRGFNGALSWNIDHPGRTFVVGSNQFCNGGQCQGLGFVRCQ
jgi:hypothetical protein